MASADARRLAGSELADALRDSRATVLARILDIGDDDWLMPRRAGVNPVAWELGHLAWFAEFWILRGPHTLRSDGFVEAAKPPVVAGPDAVFDSARLAHATRWQTPLPSRAALLRRLDDQLQACIDAIPQAADDDAAHYFHRLALFHEDMHGEAFAWLRATLAWPAPADVETMPRMQEGEPLRIAGGRVQVGSRRGAGGFAFDNEEPGVVVVLQPFEIDAEPMSNGSFLRFVESGGYDEAAFWPGPAGAWRAAHSRQHPERWRLNALGAWEARWFDRWLPLDPAAAVIHVNAWEAEAYCRWAGRRLPCAAEWECAAADARFHWGRSVWEWTASPFEPYPGFSAGPYRDYSAPWFGDHRELRGGSFATHARLHHRRYRNFFTPDRCDVFTGFRTVSLVF